MEESGTYMTLQTSRAQSDVVDPNVNPNVNVNVNVNIDPNPNSTSATMGTVANASAPKSAASASASASAPASAPPSRRVVSLPVVLNQQQTPVTDFCSNVVITSKYTPWNFLPLFMIESFKKLANAYFLLVSVLQCVPVVSNTNGLPTTLPVLLFIIAVDAVLAIIEDRRRHRADHEANSAKCLIVKSTFTPVNSCSQTPTDDPEIAVIHWSNLTVGTIVKMQNRDTAPADLLILSVAEPDPAQPNGICYVETKSLDGETNLKLRHACELTTSALSVPQLQQLQGFLRCENPNRVIGRFDGTLTVAGTGTGTGTESSQQPVSIKNVILRGCQLRNTEWMYGLVVNTGPDTKIMQSAAKPRPKWSSINETVNKMIIWLFLVLCALCAIATTGQIIWLARNKDDATYLHWEPELISQWFIGFGYYFLLIYQMIPVSLYVTISMVMFIQAIFMTMDLDVYYEELDVRLIVRSMGLNEELGQISYVFSDKTGTLTCNVMEFRKCSINGVSYGTGTTEIGRAALRRKGILVPEEVSPKEGKRAKIPYVNFEDPKLMEKLAQNTKRSVEADFFLHLSLCHTVIPERVEGQDEVRLSASSPDEQALVSGAKFFGFSFESRGLGSARVLLSDKSMMQNPNAQSELVDFRVLDVLEFTSDRKRMSVIVQYPNGEFWLLTKGADNVIFPLLSKTQNDPELLRETMEHLTTFGVDGLRTLTIARRRLDPKAYAVWSAAYKDATSSLEEIEKRKDGQPNEIDRLMTEIEQDLVLLGATAIEDKLQKHVPRAIANLMQAGMKVWMLTGDKQETAINISYACQLMDNDMKQVVLNMELFPTKDQLYRHLVDANHQAGAAVGRKAVVIDGECLEVALLDDGCRQEFLNLALSCEAVVCCRVSPSQKAEVVSLVRSSNKRARTLAIGDGANDVAMIQRAHVGVGICGQEGMQAVNSSDYAIGQFCFLEKLLLHHGRLNYKRMSIVAGYMFYKNIVMVLGQYWFTYKAGFSGQKIYSEFAFQLYNIGYTSLPIIMLGVFDYDVPWSISRHFPDLYRVGPRMELFNNRTFFLWICSALYESGMIAFFTIFGFNENWSNTGSAPVLQYGVVTFTLVVLICNLKLSLLQMSWTIPTVLLWLFGVIAYLPVSIFISSSFATLIPADYGAFKNTLLHETFWMLLPICVFTALFRHFAWTAIQRRFYPQPWQIVQEHYVLEKKHAKSPSTSHRNIVDIEAGPHNDFDFESLQAREERVSTQMQAEQGERRQRMSSGFAFSYDPQTTMAESYIAAHSVSATSTAISNAEQRQFISREDSRSSNFEDVEEMARSMHNSANALALSGGSVRASQSPGLFV